MALKIQLRDDYDAVRLRDLARCSSDPRQVRRLLSLAAVYDGLSREAAAAVGGMDRQTLRDWVHRFNRDGPDGLTNRKGAGRPRLLTLRDSHILSEAPSVLDCPEPVEASQHYDGTGLAIISGPASQACTDPSSICKASVMGCLLSSTIFS